MRHSRSAIRLLVLALAVPGALPAPVRAEPAAVSEGAPVRSNQPLLPRGRRSGLESRVVKLTRALRLDAGQQAAVRKVLQEQRQQVQRIWMDETVPAADRVAATRKVSMTTADRIRALLTEEQRKRYDPPPPADPNRAVGGAQVEEWMSGDRKR